MDNNKKITFINSPPLEFYSAITHVSGEKQLQQLCEEHKITIDEEFTYYIDNIKDNSSKFLKSEMKYFFHNDMDKFIGGIGSIIYWSELIENIDIKTVEDMINLFRESDEINLLSHAVKFSIKRYNKKSIDEICVWEDVKNDIDMMIDIINNIEIEDAEYKEILLECLNNPLETKERYCLMLKQFYEKTYKPIEKEILEKTTKTRDVYEQKFEENPDKFVRQFLKANLENYKLYNKIYISYFEFFGYNTWIRKQKDEAITVLGAFTYKYTGEEREKEKLQLLFKGLSDKKRLDIIYLLAERPWYVYELAEKLNMSAATISYHLNLLQEVDIVEYQRYDHRIYYSLDKQKFRELYEEALEILLSV